MANDLKTGLLNASIQGENQAWWGRYDYLDTYSPPATTYAQLLLAQQKCLDNFKDKHGRIEQANQFLQAFRNAMNTLDIGKIQADLEQQIEQGIDRGLMGLLNAGLKGYRDRETKTKLSGKNTVMQIQRQETNVQKAALLLTKLSANLGQQVSATELNNFLEGLKTAYQFIGTDMKRYTIAKAAEAEELVTLLISAMPQYQAFTTGAWMDENSKQLIEDNFVFKTDQLTKQLNGGAGISIQVKINMDKSDKNVYQTKIIHTLKELQEITVPIKLSNKAYEEILKLKAFSVQVKSGLGFKSIMGLGQEIFNTAQSNLRNQISLREIGDLGDVTPIEKLYQTEPFWFKEDGGYSETLNAIAHYQLSINLDKTALKNNEIYFTIYGFTTAAEWLRQSGQVLGFASPVVSMSNDILSRRRPLMFGLANSNNF